MYNRSEPCRLQETDTVPLPGRATDDLRLPPADQSVQCTPQKRFGEFAEFCCQLFLGGIKLKRYDDRVREGQ